MAIALLVMAVVTSARASLDIHRCAAAKELNPDLLTVVTIVYSLPTEFDRRSELRQTDFQDAISLNVRSVFRPPSTLMGTANSTNVNKVHKDRRPVCVQPLFVLAPWVEKKGSDDEKKLVRQDEWRQIAAESNSHGDVVIAPTMIDVHTGVRVLMHMLEWSRQRVPWADYIVSIDTTVKVIWTKMIELFPPLSSRKRRSTHKLWHLAISDPGIDALFFRDPRARKWRQCDDVGVTAFSRDLVHQMATMPFATQILHALRHPFKMYRARCESGALV